MKSSLTKQRPLRLALFPLASIAFWIASFSSLFAQVRQADPAKPSDNSPIFMTECEGVDNCAAWTFLGIQGTGQWRTGEIANLDVQSVNGETIVIRRADSTGSKAGLTAVYTGTHHEDQVGGEFTSSWPGHWENKRGNWYAILRQIKKLPVALHLCLDPSNNDCVTFRWENGQYTNYTNLAGQYGEKRVLTVNNFSPDLISFERVDYGSYPLNAVMTGQMSSDGNTLVNGFIHITSFRGQPADISAPIRMSWGSALNSIPGSDTLDKAQSQASQQPQINITPADVLQGVNTILDWVEVYQRFTALRAAFKQQQ